MEIVGICGSPRKHGNTATLLEALFAGARERGAKTTRFDPAHLKIAECEAGGRCLESAEAQCRVQDDMQVIYEALRRAEVWVFASPVYFWHLTGAMKLVIDRLYAFYTTDGGWRLGLPRRRGGVAIALQADADPETPQRVADYLASVLREFVEGDVHTLAAPGLGPADAASQRPDLLEQAKEIGRKLAAQ